MHRHTGLACLAMGAAISSLTLFAGLISPVLAQTGAASVEHSRTSALTSVATRTIVNDCYYIESRPRHINWCANTADDFQSLHWSSWALHEARARGVMRYNDCKPTCASGTDHYYKITVRLHRDVLVGSHPRFSMVSWRFVNRVNRPRQTISLLLRTEVHSWYGTARSNTFDLNSGQRAHQSRDRVVAKAGNDWIFMRADGLKDVIRCGRGNDTAMYIGRREHRDVYVGCEHVIPYSP
jgi:hypothetical protein